ncbi:hypothetical protein E3N88_28776 [Mikania micrantha]|uniref:Uncharacterized protein n=1 Tax=Mikania micrantha TaxID=192012 RepID=A0A5N6N379_9ASTR|nr:hypothetical protein E3N88_28776 [Mikania micrantha]
MRELERRHGASAVVMLPLLAGAVFRGERLLLCFLMHETHNERVANDCARAAAMETTGYVPRVGVLFSIGKKAHTQVCAGVCDDCKRSEGEKGEMKRLKELVIDAKKENIVVVPLLVSSYLQTQIEQYIRMDMVLNQFVLVIQGKELEIDSLKKLSRDYSKAKELAIKEAEKVIDTQDVNHIAKDHTLIGDVVGKTVEGWNLQKELFYQKTGLNHLKLLENRNVEQLNSNRRNFNAIFNKNSVEEDITCAENDGDFGDELEQLLLSSS